MKNKQVIGNCPLCQEHSLHFNGIDNMQVQQCINCGMASTKPFILENNQSKEDNEAFNKLTPEMQNWSVEKQGRVWIPSMITLPFGMLYPFNDDKSKMKWSFAEMVDIPEEKQSEYPIQDQPGTNYKRMYDTKNSSVYDTFLEGLEDMNKKAKDAKPTETEVKLPKLKKQ
jgi:Zn ribbon nucleic-acid-binding protein